MGIIVECYQYFTGNLDRLKRKLDADSPGPSSRPSMRRTSGESDRHIFKPDCIFCRKKVLKKIKVGQSWTTEPLSKFEYGGGDRVQCVAKQKNDFELLTGIKRV